MTLDGFITSLTLLIGGYALISPVRKMQLHLAARGIEPLLNERGIDISHDMVRFWWNRFGPVFAADIRRQRVSRMKGFRHWNWHLDEMYVKIGGEMHYLWRAADQEGEMLESFVTKTRDKHSALSFIKKALKQHGNVETITTDGPLGRRPQVADRPCGTSGRLALDC